MKIIGLTGASGAGKSTVVKMLGFKTVDADKISREVMLPDSECLKAIVKAFGEDVLCDDGSLNRKELAKRAFSSKEKTELLNSVAHPFIKKEIHNQIKNYKLQGEKVIILDAPQLFEAKCEQFCDITVGVLADKSVRKKRIMLRDNITEEQANTRLNAGKPDEFFIKNCDYIIINDGELDKLQMNVKKFILSLDI